MLSHKVTAGRNSKAVTYQVGFADLPCSIHQKNLVRLRQEELFKCACEFSEQHCFTYKYNAKIGIILTNPILSTGIIRINTMVNLGIIQKVLHPNRKSFLKGLMNSILIFLSDSYDDYPLHTRLLINSSLSPGRKSITGISIIVYAPGAHLRAALAAHTRI